MSAGWMGWRRVVFFEVTGVAGKRGEECALLVALSACSCTSSAHRPAYLPSSTVRACVDSVLSILRLSRRVVGGWECWDVLR